MIPSDIKRKVLVLYSSASAACGIGTWIENLNQTLPLYGWDLVVGLAWGRKFHDPKQVEQLRSQLSTVRMDGRTGTEEGRIRAIEKTIRIVEPDIVMLTCLDDAFEAVRRLRCNRQYFRFMVVNHGNVPKQAACLLQHRDLIDMAICVSRFSFLAMNNVKEHFEKERFCHVPNAVPLQNFKKKRMLNRFCVGYAGRLDVDKRAVDLLPFFLELNKICPDAELWVAGQGERAGEITTLAGRFPDRVKYFGQLTTPELNTTFYPSLDVLIHFSPSEAWGYSIAEAMSFGVVPVVSDFRGRKIDELIIERQTGMVFPVGNVKAAAEAVCELFESPDYHQRMSVNTREHIKQNYSLKKFGEAWAQALSLCCSLPVLTMQKRTGIRSEKSRWMVGEGFLESMRSLLRRRVTHASPGEEWPHFRCNSPLLLKQITAIMASLYEKE
ncbi:MAG: glycosyltransferase family 4 protein [Planctomycetota bacterium]